MELGLAMEQEILAQPTLLSENLSRYESESQSLLAGKSFESVVLIARGSSDHAALYLRYLVEVFWRIPAVLAAPSVFTRYGSVVEYPKSLVVGISQSGAAPDVSETLASLRSRGHLTLAVTNTPGSRITTAADHVFELGVGAETSVAATKTYTASLLVGYCLVRALAPNIPSPKVPDEALCERHRTAAMTALGAVLRSDRWFALARGYSYCSAQETALKMMECALMPFKAYSVADFQHGPRALAGHGSMAVVFGQVPDNLLQAGCLIESAPFFEDTPDSPISNILFGQWLALLAARARGLDPDRPQNLTKVTETL